jgi:hypothetical protein
MYVCARVVVVFAVTAMPGVYSRRDSVVICRAVLAHARGCVVFFNR